MESFVPIDLAKAVLDNVAAQIQGKDVRVTFSGGEPTVHPDFIELVEYTAAKGMQANLISNGSRSLAYYQKLAAALNGTITMTYHAEYANENKFLTNITAFQKTKAIVFVPMNEAYWDTCSRIFEKLLADGFYVYPKTMMDDFGVPGAARQHKYTPEHQAYIKDTNARAAKQNGIIRVSTSPNMVLPKAPFVPKNKIKLAQRLVEITRDNGKKEIVTVHQLLANKETHMTGMDCWAGVESINITTTGKVFKADCRQDGEIGNIYKNPNFIIPTEPTTCTKQNCWCTDDLKLTKQDNGKIKMIPIVPA
jgi:organic radical activating enzyme